MATLDFERVKKRVFDLIGASPSGSFSATINPRSKTRSAPAIIAAVEEAGLRILQTIGSFPNEFRSNLINVLPAQHGELLPDHLGQPAFVEIQRFDGAPFRTGDRRDKTKIESYRANINKIYDTFEHNEENSSFAGYYDIWERKLYYTGFAAQVGLAQAQRSDVTTKIPDFFESTIVKLALANLPKAGEGAYVLQIAQFYNNAAENDLAEFKGGKRRFAEISAPDALLPKHE
jgi:hypothetical protein